MCTRHVLSASLIAGALAGAVHAAPAVIYTNTSNLLPNTADQVLQLWVMPGDPGNPDTILGENLNFQINTGTSGPIFTGVDILTGTIFAASNTGQNHPNDPAFDSQCIYTQGTLSGHLAVALTTTQRGTTTTDNGLLATLYVSTTGSSDIFSLNMLNTVNGRSTFGLGGSLTLALTFPHNRLSISDAPVREWKANGGGSWDSDVNWTPFAPYARGDAANFLGALTGGTGTISLEGVRTVGSVNFDNAVGSFDIEAGNGGSFLLDNGSAVPLIASLAGSHKIAAPVALTADTNVSVASGSVLTLSGGVSGGTSRLSLTGGGKLILTGGNSYGATHIGAGSTLQIGNGTESGSLGTSAIDNGGALVLSTMAAPLAVPMGGVGSVEIIGLVVFTDVSTAANLSITPTGTLQVGDGGTRGTLGSGSVVNSGNLAFDRSDAAEHGVTISGGGTLTQAGTGTTTLTGAASYSGPTQVAAGQLTFGGSGVSHSIAGVAGSGTLAVAAGTHLTSDGVNLPTGTVALEGDLTLRSSTASAYANFATGQGAAALSGTSKVSNLTVTSGTLDIKDNALIVQTADSTSRATAIAQIAGYLGTTITSSSAATSAKYTLDVIDNSKLGASSFGGLTVDSNSLIVTEALKGDANMDGSVGAADLTIWKANFGKSGVYAANAGDFNHDGSVGAADLTIWKANFGANLTSAPAPLGGVTGGISTLGGTTPLTGGAATSAVPEPASLAVLALGMVGWLGRRKMRKGV